MPHTGGQMREILLLFRSILRMQDTSLLHWGRSFTLEKHQTSLTITLIAGPCDHIFPQLKNRKMPRFVLVWMVNCTPTLYVQLICHNSQKRPSQTFKAHSLPSTSYNNIQQTTILKVNHSSWLLGTTSHIYL